MHRILGRTKDEIQAVSIARGLVDALSRLELFDDQDLVLSSAQTLVGAASFLPSKLNAELSVAIASLRELYCGEARREDH
jgi:hypothetical protein